MAVTGLTAGPIPLVSIVIVNYNTLPYLKNCLTSIEMSTYPNYEIILVDNASTDKSVEFVERNFPSIRVIKNVQNVGSAAGNNIGISAARGDYIFLLNPDTEVEPSCIHNLVEVLNKDPKVGVCGAKLLLLDKKRILQHAGGKYHPIGVSIDRGVFEEDKNRYSKIEEVTFVCGAALMVRRRLFSEIGMLDPAFFLYHEEVDFCIRTWLHGFKVVYVPAAVVYHKSGYVSELDKRTTSPLVVFHKHKNTLIILLKNFPLSIFFLYFPLAILYKFFWIVVFLLKKDSKSALAVFESIVWFLQNLGNVFVERRKIAKLKIVGEATFDRLFCTMRDVYYTYRKLINWVR
jgi:GT2 family glycosyltransferase